MQYIDVYKQIFLVVSEWGNSLGRASSNGLMENRFLKFILFFSLLWILEEYAVHGARKESNRKKVHKPKNLKMLALSCLAIII